MSSVVVAGGTGFIGRSLVDRLATAGHPVTVLARDTEAARRSLGARARVLAWSLDAGPVRDAWEREVAAATGVVNLAGAGVMDKAWTEARKRELYASRIDVTGALAMAMAKEPSRLEAPRVFVSASAVGIYGPQTDDALQTEDSPPGSDFLAALCVEWEAAAAPAREGGVRVVHPRLGIVLGREGGALAKMSLAFKLHAGGPLGSGAQWVSWIHERDVVLALERALTSGSLNGAYNFVAPRPVTMEEEAELIAKVLNTHARARIPAFVLTATLGAGRAETVLTGQRVSAARLVEAGYPFLYEALLPALTDLLGHA
jgi:uncharacterized protein (TIGR01777 family)